MAPPVVTIVGRGRVGSTLARALRPVADVRLTQGHAPRGPYRGAVVLAVPDPAIAEVDAALAPRLVEGAVVLHCSGSHGAELLASARAAGHAVGAMHPLVSFRARTDPAALRESAFVIEGDRAAVASARRIAVAVGARPVVADVHGPAYHALCALSANGAAALGAVAARGLSALGLSAPDARRAIGALLRTVADNVAETDAPLSGPILRGDADAIRRHRAALAEADPDALAAYDAVAPAILVAARREGLSIAGARAIRRALRRPSQGASLPAIGPAIVESRDRALAALGATVYVAVKDAPRGRWRTVESGLSFEEGVDAVADHAVNAYEAAILVEAGPMRGVILWTSVFPDVVNEVRE